MLSHAFTKLVTQPVAAIAHFERDLIGSMGKKTTAAKPLYKTVPILDDFGAKTGERQELTEYGKQVDAGQEKDVLGQLAIGLDAYNNNTATSDSENKLPNTFLGNTAASAINIAPDIAATALFPESKIAGTGIMAAAKRALAAPFTKLLATKGALNSYDEAKQKGANMTTALKESLSGGLKGAGEGMIMHQLSEIAGDFVSPATAKALEKTGLVKNGKYTKMGTDALADAVVFGSYPIATALIKGEKPSVEEIESGIGTGLGFGLMKAGKTYEQHTDIEKKLNNVRDASALQTFITADPQAIVDAFNLKGTSGDIMGEAVQAASKVKPMTDADKKMDAAVTASTLYKAASVKKVSEAIVNDKDGFIESISQSELPQEQKDLIIQKVNDLYPKLHPAEVAKTNVAGQIKDIDEQLAELKSTPVDGTDIKAQAEYEVKVKQLEDERTRLYDGLKNIVQEQGKPLVVTVDENNIPNTDNNEQTIPNQEIPAEQPADEATGVPETIDKVNEANGGDKVEHTITVNEVKDLPIVYNGEPASIIQDGQTLVAKIKGTNREYELGNVDDIGDKSIKDFGIEHENSVVDTHDNGNIIVRGKEYVNNYSDPKSAINYDNDGNVVSVNLETPDGAKRAFKGDVAEDIAYQIHLKELNKDNEIKQQFEQFVEQHEPSRSTIVAGENEVAAEKGTIENNEPVSRKPAKPRKEKPVIIKEDKNLPPVLDVSEPISPNGENDNIVKDEAPVKPSDEKPADNKVESTTAEITPQKAVKAMATGDQLEVPGLKGSEYTLAATELPNGKHGVFETNSGKLISNLYDSREELIKNFEGSKDKITPDAIKEKVEASTFIDNSKELEPEDIKEANDDLKQDNITLKEIKNYESNLQQQSGGGSEPAPIEDIPEVIQQPKDEPATDAGKDTGGEGLPPDSVKEEVVDDKAKTLAEKIRSLKINKTAADVKKNMHGGLQGVGVAAWDGAIETVATIVEKGGKLADAIKAGIAHIKANSDVKDDDKIKAALTEKLSGIGIEENNESPVEPKKANEVRDDKENLKTASLKSKSLDNQVKKEAPKDELLKEFTSLDPRYFTPDEVQRYNELTTGKTPTQLERDNIAKFIDDFRSRQEEDALKREQDWYKQVEADDDITAKEAKEVLKEAAETTDESPDLETTDKNKKAKNAFTKIITQYKKTLRGTDVPEDMADVKQALIEIDETKLSTKQARETAKVMDNILYDGNYAGAGRIIALNEAVKNAKVILDDLVKRGFDKGDISQFWADFRTLDQNVEMISKTTKGASVIQDKAGIQRISAGNAQVNKLMNDLSKEYNALTDKMGKDILSVENRFKRGILGSILQVADKDTPEVSFARYKNYIKETGEILSKSKDKAEQKEGELVTSLYNKFLDGTETADEVVKAITKDNPNNTKLVNFFVKKFEGTYGDLRINTLLYSGKDLPFITQYTPTVMKLLKGVEPLAAPDVSITDPLSFDGSSEPTDTRGSRTSISRKDLRTLKGLNRVLNLNFDGIAFDKFRETNYDIKTMEARHLFDNIRKMGDFQDALGGKTNVNVISNGVSQMVRRQKGYNRSSPEARAVVQALNIATAKGVRIALQGVSQFLKQYPSVGLNTLANLGPDIDLYFKSMIRLGLKNPIFDQSGIGLRAGQHGGTSFEMDLKRLKNTDFSGPVTKSLSALSGVGDKLSNVFGFALSKSDDAVARNSWGAYYMKDLRRQGVDINELDWDNEHKNINQEAAAYAEQMVSRNQIQNDPSKQANFLYGGDIESAKDVGAHVLKGIAFPFSSFARNAQARMESDLRKFSGGDRKEAIVSMVSGMAEAAAFNAIKIALIGSAVNWASAKILPQFGFASPPDKPLEDRAKAIPAQALNDMLLAGFGAAGDNLITKGLNRVINPHDDKKLKKYLVPEYNPNDYGETDWGLAGIYGVLPGKIYQAYKEADYVDGEPTGEAYDRNSKEMVKYQSKLTDKQKHMAQLVFAIDVLGMMGISDADVLRINQKLFREMKSEKDPVKFYSGYNKNTKAKPVKVK